MSKAHKEFEAAFDRYLDAVGPTDALTSATSIFVGLVVSLVDTNGGDASGPIKIDGGDQRDITIHPLKPSTKGEPT